MSERNGSIGADGDEGSTVADPSAAVAAGYDQLASHWDYEAAETYPDLRSTYLERLEAWLSPGSAVLELGCGTGRPVGTRLAPVHNYLGVDASKQMVELARQNVPDGQFQVADMTTLDLPDDSFDAVAAFLLHHPCPPRQTTRPVLTNPILVAAGWTLCGLPLCW